jgi:hypothetical protein
LGKLPSYLYSTCVFVVPKSMATTAELVPASDLVNVGIKIPFIFSFVFTEI